MGEKGQIQRHPKKVIGAKIVLGKKDSREERFQQGIRTLQELSDKGTPIVVEGVKDVSALSKLGLNGPIHVLAGHSLVSFADELSQIDEVLILFDFDRRGNRLTYQLTELLQGYGVTILQDIRQKLRHAFSWRVRVIEGLKPINDSPKAAKL